MPSRAMQRYYDLKSDKNRYTEYLNKQRIYQLQYRRRNPQVVTTWKQRAEYNSKTKLLTMIGKGQIQCVRCGCNDRRFLEINHKNGGGSKEKKIYKSNGGFRNAILCGKRGVDDLELLCRMCNALDYLERKFGTVPCKIIWEVS